MCRTPFKVTFNLGAVDLEYQQKVRQAYPEEYQRRELVLIGALSEKFEDLNIAHQGDPKETL